MSATREARSHMSKEAVKLTKKLEAAIAQFQAIENQSGDAADILALCDMRAGGVRGALDRALEFSWHLENELERLGAKRKPEERSSLLIREVALELRKDGLPLNENVSGPLYQIAGLVLELVGEQPKDLRGTVRQVLSRSLLG